MDSQTVRTQAFARAGLLGNPSDGYFGKIIAVSVKNFSARVELSESDKLRILPGERDEPVFESMEELVSHVGLYGYYGGQRLIMAAIKQFFQHCRQKNLRPEQKNFMMGYTTDIPRQLGMGGSSAIITAALRALMRFYGVNIPATIQPTLILAAEREELGINAGFMDRVIQVMEGCVYMDLEEKTVRARGYGRYESLDPALLPPLYLAYKPSLGKVSGRVLNPIREGYDRKDPEVMDTLRRIASLAELGREALLAGDRVGLKRMMDENFLLRSRIMPIDPRNMELIEAARTCGASAKFAGSGGSIIGVYQDEAEFGRLKQKLRDFGAVVLKPQVE